MPSKCLRKVVNILMRWVRASSPATLLGDEQSSDTAELNALRKGGFRGKCHHCGQFGHKIAERRMKK